MGCNTSNDVMPKDYTLDNEKPQIPRSPNLKTDYPIAFEVPFHDLETAGKKPLPQKLQRLQEQQQTPEPEETMKMLQKRLADAEQRRQQILSMRVNSAQQFQLKGRTAS